MAMTAAEAAPATLVLGLGRSGMGAARLLRQRQQAVLVLESNNGKTQQHLADQLRQEGIAVQLGTPLNAASIDALGFTPPRVVVSPGIRWDHPCLQELRQRLVLAELLMEAALFREESRGGHFRLDAPLTQPFWCRHTLQQRCQQISTEPVGC